MISDVHQEISSVEQIDEPKEESNNAHDSSEHGFRQLPSLSKPGVFNNGGKSDNHGESTVDTKEEETSEEENSPEVGGVGHGNTGRVGHKRQFKTSFSVNVFTEGFVLGCFVTSFPDETQHFVHTYSSKQ